MKQAVLMARVSSDEQAKGYSLDIQIEKLTAYCKKENITIVGVYKEDHSAKNFIRPEFNKMLTFLKESRGKIDFLLITTWDRFSRNVSLSFGMIERIRNYGCEVLAIEQPLDLSIPENLMLLSVYLALPDVDNKRRSIKITEGVRAARMQGYWLGIPPFGYKKQKNELNKSVLIPNEKAVIVKFIFNELARGKTQAELKPVLQKKFNTYFSRSTLSDLIRNKVYIGKIHVRSSENSFYVNGIHEPLVNEEIFYKAQENLDSNLKKKKFVKVKSEKEEFPLRGCIKCDNCLKNLTGSFSRSKNGKKYAYYHCNACGKTRLRVEDVNKRIRAILSEIKISAPAKKIFGQMVKHILSSEDSIKKRPSEKIEQEILRLEQRLQKIQDTYADNEIDLETFIQTSDRYKSRILSLRKELESNSNDKSLYEKYFTNGIDLLSNLTEFFEKANPERKRKILCSTFPENLYFGREKNRTPRINEAILLILNTSKGFSQKETGQLFKNLELSGVVENTGVEALTFPT